MSLDKKILKGNYSTSPYKEARAEIKRAWQGDVQEKQKKQPPQRHYECRRNKGNHSLALVVPNDEKYPSSQAQNWANMFDPKKSRPNSWSKGAQVYQCTACGRVEYRWIK